METTPYGGNPSSRNNWDTDSWSPVRGWLRAQFHDAFALFQPGHHLGPKRGEPREQGGVGTIAQPNPYQRHLLAAQEPAVGKILILGEKDGLLAECVGPDRRVIGGLQPEGSDVGGCVPLLGYPVRQGWRQLGIHHEVHAV